MNRNIPYYLMAIVLFALLKFLAGSFGNDKMSFLLTPTNAIIEMGTGTHSDYSSERGFYYDSFNIVIDKSCSGYNFLLLCFVMLYFQTVKHAKKGIFKLLLLPGCLTISYILTILINSSRIFISVVFRDARFNFLNLKPDIVHESIGVITYLSFLLIIYFLTNKILQKEYAQLT